MNKQTVTVEQAYSERLWERGTLRMFRGELHSVSGIEQYGQTAKFFTVRVFRSIRSASTKMDYYVQGDEQLEFTPDPHTEEPTVAELLKRIAALEAEVKTLKNNKEDY